jgi:hypothetical protein
VDLESPVGNRISTSVTHAVAAFIEFGEGAFYFRGVLDEFVKRRCLGMALGAEE